MKKLLLVGLFGIVILLLWKILKYYSTGEIWNFEIHPIWE